MTDFFSLTTYITYATIPSAIILIVLCWLQKRQKPGRCGGRPGIVVPMRFLDGYTDRWAYALAFGAITSILLSVFTQTVLTDDDGSILLCPNSTSSLCNEVWVKSLLIQAQTVVGSLVCVPHFICITTPYKLLGAIFGFAYSLYWSVFYIVGFARNEKYYDRTIGSLKILGDVPIVLCCIGLMARSAWTCYLCYKKRSVVRQEVDSLVEVHQVKHVQTLFQHKPESEPDPPEGCKDKLTEKVKSQFFPHFKLPTRIVCIAVVQIIMIYYVAISLTQIGVAVRRQVKVLLSQNVSGGDTILRISDGTQVVAEILGVTSALIYTLLFVINYRNNLIHIYKGDKHGLLQNPGSPQELVVRSLRLPGYQIAYIVWGLIVMYLAVYMVVGIVTLGIYGLWRLGMLSSVFKSLVQSLSVPASTLLVYYVQVLLVRLFLMQPKIHEDDGAPPLNIDNRRVYELLSYFFVFNNLVVGIFSVLLRTLKSFLLGLIFLGRLDRCLLMKGFETFDPGYMAYVGTLLVDNAHNNPTMRTFCAVLVRLRCKTEVEKEQLGIRHLPEPEKLCSNSRAARRWHLAYTLLHNPDLLPRRKLALLLTRGLEDGDDDEKGHKKRRTQQSQRRQRQVDVLEIQDSPELDRRRPATVEWSMSDPGSTCTSDVTGYPDRGDKHNLQSEMRFRNGVDRGRQHQQVTDDRQYGAMNAMENPVFFQNETPNLL